MVWSNNMTRLMTLRVKECPREEAHTPHAWSTTSPDRQFFCPGKEEK